MTSLRIIQIMNQDKSYLISGVWFSGDDAWQDADSFKL